MSRAWIGTGLALASLLAMAACSKAGEGDDDESSALQAGIEQESDFVVLDRMGRPEMTNLTMSMGKAGMVDFPGLESEGLRREHAQRATAPKLGLVEAEAAADVRAYNRQNTFHPQPGEREHAKRALTAGIRASDEVGFVFHNEKDWSERDLEIMGDILSEDALVVDISKPCHKDTQGLFEIERAELLARGVKLNDGPRSGPATCGGRTLNDDVIDHVITAWVNKSFDWSPNNRLRVSDGIDKPKLDDGETSDTFPYLGEPHVRFEP